MKMLDANDINDSTDMDEAAKADRRLNVRFTYEKRPNHAADTRVAEHNQAIEDKAVLLDHAHKFEEAKALRADKLPDEPIYRQVEFVTIRVPGQHDFIHRKVMPSDKIRFRAQYEAFKNANGEALEGTPVTELPGIKDTTVRNLAYVGITTIEQLANVADALLKMMGGQQLKQQAKEWVAKNRKSSIVNQTNEALAERDAKIADLEAKLNQLLAAQEPAKAAKAASK